MSTLAIKGGTPERTKPWDTRPMVGPLEKRALAEVINNRCLSGFVAQKGDKWLGGPKVREFEEKFAAYIGIKHAVSFNSATSALHAAVLALTKLDQRVICSPFTFSASASCVYQAGREVNFAEIEDSFFGLDPEKIDSANYGDVGAVIPVHLFGHACEVEDLRKRVYNWDQHTYIIEDCAQSLGAVYRGRKVGLWGDCGVFSFTENKNMTTGEGGMLVTNDDDVKDAAQHIRNHGEAVESDWLGYNYRMTEMSAAVGIVQLTKIDKYNRHRRRLAHHLTERLRGLPGILPPVESTKFFRHVGVVGAPPGMSIEKVDHAKARAKASGYACSDCGTIHREAKCDCDQMDHVYYMYPLIFNPNLVGVSRKVFVEAVKAEGIPLVEGYNKPLYLNKWYVDRGEKGAGAFDAKWYPTVEKLWTECLIVTSLTRPPFARKDMDDIANAIIKVYEHREELRDAH